MGQHLHSRLCDDSSLQLQCPAAGCRALLSPFQAASFVADTLDHNCVGRWEGRLASAGFAEQNGLAQCPKCEQFVQHVGAEQEAEAVGCGCGHSFCAGCVRRGASFEDHRPVTCKQRLEWETRQSQLEDSQSTRRVFELTRPCPWPGCGFRQERSDGCQHIQCGRATGGTRIEGIGCGRDWCWNCGRPSGKSEEGFCNYSCGGVLHEAFQGKLTEDRQKHAFLLFFDKWLTLASELKRSDLVAQAEERCESILSHPEQFQAFSDPAVQELIRRGAATELEIKRLLMNTYVLAYFVPSELEFHSVFLGFQGYVESCSDRLSRVNRAPLLKLEIIELKAAVTTAQLSITGMRDNLARLAQLASETDSSSSSSTTSTTSSSFSYSL